jgi:hypothetical protein
MPTQLLFIMPFFLILVVRQLSPIAFTTFLVLYAGADYAYFTKHGFLVKPYAAPFKEMADVILEGSRGQSSTVALDTVGLFYQPLLTRLSDSVRVVLVNDYSSAEEVLEVARSAPSGPSVIWLWRRASDISQVTKLEQDLSVGYEVRHHEFVAYSLPERWVRRLLRGPGQPQYYYSLSEFRPSGHSGIHTSYQSNLSATAKSEAAKP